MKSFMAVAGLIMVGMLTQTGCTVTSGVPPPPEPIVEFSGPTPYVGAVWAPGHWVWHGERRRYEWHHGEWRH